MYQTGRAAKTIPGDRNPVNLVPVERLLVCQAIVFQRGFRETEAFGVVHDETRQNIAKAGAAQQDLSLIHI